MTLPATFPLTMSQVAAELGTTLPLSLLDPRVVSLAGKSGPPVSMSDLLGKSAFNGDTTMVAGTYGSDSNITGYASGVDYSAFGTLSPTVVDGVTLQEIWTWYPAAGSKEFTFKKSPGLDDNFLTMRIVGPGMDKTYQRSQFTMSPNNIDEYLFEGTASDVSKITSGSTYQIALEFAPVRTVGAADGGASGVGFQQGNFGTISYAPYRQTTVTAVYTDAIGFAFLLAGTLAQNFINNVIIFANDAPSTRYEFQQYLASSYGQNGGNTYWYWDAPAFTMVAGKTYTVQIC